MIWLPASEILTALDFKYPSYREGKAGYQSLICMCRRLVFKMWEMQLQHHWLYECTGQSSLLLSSLMQHRDEQLFDVNSPCKAELNLIWSAIRVEWRPQRTFWNPFSNVPAGCKGKLAALNFLLHKVISSNQPGVNQRHLILSEWLWDYLDTPFLLLEVKRGAACAWTLCEIPNNALYTFSLSHQLSFRH